MFVIHGTRPYGKCDVVPELFYVSTWFFHINFVPLVPTGTNLVLGKNGSSYQTVKIPFSFKSLLLAWARAASILFVFATTAWAIDVNLHPLKARETGPLLPVLAAVFCITICIFLFVYPTRRMPSYKRACQLGMLAGLNETGWAALNVLYGRDPLERPEQDPPAEVLRAK